MSDMTAFFYIKCATETQLKRLSDFLDVDNQPDFEDDLADGDQHLFELIENVPDVEELSANSSTELTVFFEFNAFEAKEELPKLLAATECETAICLTDSYDETHYHKLNGDSFNFLYSPNPLEDPLDEKDYNQNLTGEALSGAKAAYEKGMLSLLLYLGRL